MFEGKSYGKKADSVIYIAITVALIVGVAIGCIIAWIF